jgi:CheY-like chemotaxis protein
MPRLDGNSTLRALKANPDLRTIPVVIVTAIGGVSRPSKG